MDPFCRQYARKQSDDEINAGIEKFLSGGGKAKKLRAPDKTFREIPAGGGIFLSDRDERLLAD